MSQKTTRERTYFANETDAKKLAGAIWERRTNYQKYLRESGLWSLYRKMHWMYYGQDKNGFSSHAVEADGPEGEISRYRLNHLRSIVTSWLNLATNQRPTMDPLAVDGDYESYVQVKRARALLDHYQFKRHFEEIEADCIEQAAVLGSCYEFRRWNSNLGEVVLPTSLPELGLQVEQGQMSPDQAQQTENQVRGEANKRAGDIEAFAVGVLDAMFDPHRKNAKHPWMIFRLYENRYDLISRYPRYEQQLLAVTGRNDDYDIDFDYQNGLGASSECSEDEIPVLYFMHERSEAVPDGRSACVIDGNTLLHEGPLGYREIPGRRIAAANLTRTPWAYTPAFDLLAPQEACDALSTITLTNQKTFGLGAILSPKGQDIDPVQVSEGLVLVEYVPGLPEPKALEMPATPQDIYTARKDWVSEMGIILGVNGVVRGDPQASLKSGAALALVQAMAVQFSSTFQGGITRYREEKAMDLVLIAQDNMTEPRQFEIYGQHTSSLTESFDGSGLKKVVKFRCNQINPLAKTLPGRVEMADAVMERFADKLQPGDYFRILESGNADHLTRGAMQKQALIERENEMLARGIGPMPKAPMMGPNGLPVIDPTTGQPKMVPTPEEGQQYIVCLITDDHRAHVIEHLDVLANPAIRQTATPEAAAVVKAVLDHIDEHEQQLALMTTQRPALLELTNQMPLQAALPPPVLDPNAKPGEPKGASPPPKPKANDAMQPAPPGGNQTPKMPQMPVNPATGERVESPPPPVAAN